MKPVNWLVPVLLLLLPLLAWLIGPAGPQTLVVGAAAFFLALAIWAAGRLLAARTLAMVTGGGAAGLFMAALCLPAIGAVTASPAAQALLILMASAAGSIIGAGWAFEKSVAAPPAARGGEAVDMGTHAAPKVCDTSVLIDGRLADMAAAGFIEGEIVIPQFVLHELQGIADSAEQLKRNRGRRGLDIVRQLQEIKGMKVRIATQDYRDESQVDHKLIRLAADLQAVLVTNDFNLNKVARVRNVRVFNLNDLVNALKTIYLPGEEITVAVSREGKEDGQGVGYLNDGTMVVVDGAAAHIGHEVRAVVTNIHQTTAGRMIFTRIENSTGKKDGRADRHT